MRWLPTLVFAFFCGLGPVDALATFEEGRDAFARGQYQLAIELWDSAADKGDARAINNLGYLYANGIHVPRDLAKAVSLYRQAVDLNRDPNAMTNLGWAQLNGLGTDRDVAKGIELVREAAEIHQVPLARLYLGQAYAAGWGVPLNQRAACENFIAASADLPEAVGTAAVCVEEGVGAPRDVSRAMMMYRSAVKDINDTGAMVNLARLTLDGADAKEYPDAIRLLERAADLKHPGAPALLGDAYLHGKGVPVDPSRAVQLYEESLKRFGATAKAKSGVDPGQIDNFSNRVRANLEIAKSRSEAVTANATVAPTSVAEADSDGPASAARTGSSPLGAGPDARNEIAVALGQARPAHVPVQSAGNASPFDDGLPVLDRERGRVWDPVSGNWYDLTPEELASFPERSIPKPVAPSAPDPMTPEWSEPVAELEGVSGNQSRPVAPSIGFARFAAGAAGTLIPALVATLIGYAISRLFSRRAVAWWVIIGALLTCWLLATIIHVLLGDLFFSAPPNSLGTIAALAVLAALFFVSFGRGSAFAEISDLTMMNDSHGEATRGVQLRTTSYVAKGMGPFAKALATVAVLFVVGIWRAVERDLGYPLGIFGSFLRGGAAFMALAWIWGLTALIGSGTSRRSPKQRQSTGAANLIPPVDQAIPPATMGEAAPDATGTPTNDAVRDAWGGVGYAELTHREPAVGNSSPESNNRRNQGFVMGEVVGPTEATMSQPALTANDEDALYEQAWNEISSGAPVAAVWARAYAVSEGDEAKTRAAYIRFRVASGRADTDDTI